MMGNFIDLTGQRFGRLTVVEQAENQPNRQTRWRCHCDCGEYVTVRRGDLTSGKIKSCGCLRKEIAQRRIQTVNATASFDRHTKTRLWRIWNGMKNRCELQAYSGYMNYGGRGIQVCDQWKSDFYTFQAWALSHGYRDNLTIDRIDVNGDYTPENCRWATRKTQSNNRRDNRLVIYCGETHTLTEWARIVGISVETLRGRLRLNWPIERALTEPVQIQKPHRKK